MDITKIFSPALVSAVRQINKLISDGWEYPDASAKVAVKTGFLQDELARAYDAQHE